MTQLRQFASRFGREPIGGIASPSRRALVGAASGLIVVLVSTAGRAAPPDVSSAAGGSSPPHAAPTRAECLDAHRAAQEFRQVSKLVEAGEQLRICSSATCPGPVIADCGGWINELEQATPSMVFEVEADGKESTEAKLFVDQLPVTDLSQPLRVNPGKHVVRAELPPFPPHDETVFMAEGHRMRLVPIKFDSAKPPAPPTPAVERPPVPIAPVEERRPIPTVVYPLVGVGVVGLASFAVFAAMGRSKQTSLDQSCAPDCSSSDLQSMKTNYLIGDVSLGVGLAAIVGAVVVYFVRPVERVAATPTLSLSVGPIGEVARRNPSWGAAAAMIW